MAQVLMLEGETGLSILLGHYLRSVGHTVTIASSLIESTVWLDLASFDLVVVDIVEDVQERLDFCRSLKASLPRSRTRLLVVSATPEMESRATAAGADAFLSKPLALHQIRDCVSDLVAALATPGSGPLALPAGMYAS